MKRMFVPGVLMVICAGCATHPLQVVEAPAIADVQAEIKRQIGIYLAEATPVTLGDDYICGKGKINFDIVAVKVELTTTQDSTKDVKGGLSGSIGAITIGPSTEQKTEVVNTQAITYNLWLIPGQATAFDRGGKKAPIADTLLSLRNGLIEASKKQFTRGGKSLERAPQPCFFDYNPDKPGADAGNTFKIALSMSSDVTNGISIDVGIISLSDTKEDKATTGNTITVSFLQSGMEKIQYAKDGVDTECKYPNREKQSCKDAQERLRQALAGQTGVGIMVPPGG